MAGPWAGQTLADLGADVIKVERPGAGDDTRAWGPPFLLTESGEPTKEAGYYLAVNRGKRSITIDLTTSEGQGIVRELAKRCDILLENYKVGTLSKFGLGPPHLRAANPALIYCSITGFGQTGPRSSQVAYDFAIQAMGGLMSVTGERDALPGGGPQKVGVPIIDIMTGMYAATAVLASIARRAVTGQGDHIDISMLDVAVATLANQGMNHLLSGSTPRRTGNRHPNIQPQDVFDCADGQIVVAVGNDIQFGRLCAALDAHELGQDPRFKTNATRLANLPELLIQLRNRIAKYPAKALTAELDRAGVPCGVINSIPDALTDPQIQHRNLVQALPHPRAGSVPQILSPMRFADADLSIGRAPPLLGAHTEEILRELGLEGAHIASLRGLGAI